MGIKKKTLILSSLTFYSVLGLALIPAQGQTSKAGSSSDIVSKEAPADETELRAADYSNAKPLIRIVKTRSAPAPATTVSESGAPGFSPGRAPTVAANTFKALQLIPPKDLDRPSRAVEPSNFGTLNHPFTTARVATKSGSVNPATVFPYLPAGKLFFKIGASTFVCSASVIRPRVVVTAAHCVSEFGTNRLYSNFEFFPGYTNGKAPVGKWTYKRVFVKKSYLNGTDTCLPGAEGVVCSNDVAVFVMNDKNGKKIGNVTGTFGYGFNGYGYTSFLKNRTSHITQLGYPVALDNGGLMQRNDSLSYIDENLVKNQIIGSLMTGGSSGGPWLVNFGIAPSTTGIAAGNAPKPNLVVGVTSWGYRDSSLQEQGASRFTDQNIVPLVKEACSADPGNC
ncbi:MAG TPA: trypsin-like serine protease [Stenomitos sp.]